MKIIFFLISIIFNCVVLAQYKVLDIETHQPICSVQVFSNSKLVAQTDRQGIFYYQAQLNEELVFEHGDYIEEKINPSEWSDSIVYLVTKYHPLHEVIITSRLLTIPEIFKLIANKTEENILNSQIPLVYRHNFYASNLHDASISVSFPILAHGPYKNHYLAYRNYYLSDSVEVMSDNAISSVQGLPSFFNYLNQIKSFEKLFNAKYAKDLMKEYHLVLSSFEKNGQNYLDIVFIPKNEHLIYWDKKYKGSTDFSFYQIMNFQINMSNYAIEYMRAFSLPSEETDSLSVAGINDRNDYNEFLKNKIQPENSYRKIDLKFQFNEHYQKYIIDHYLITYNRYLSIDSTWKYGNKCLVYSWVFDREADKDWTSHWRFLHGYNNLYNDILVKGDQVK